LTWLTWLTVRPYLSVQTDAKGDLAKASVLYPAPVRYEVTHRRTVEWFTPLACILFRGAHSWNAADGFLPTF
jgi:hypothetical protein